MQIYYLGELVTSTHGRHIRIHWSNPPSLLRRDNNNKIDKLKMNFCFDANIQ